MIEQIHKESDEILEQLLTVVEDENYPLGNNGQFAGKVLKRFGFVGVDLKDLV